MQFYPRLQIGFLLTACLYAQGQSVPGKDPHNDLKGLPPRQTHADYQAHAQAGAVIVAAEFKGHSIPTLQGALSTDDYVVVEVGLFGAPGARAKVSSENFSLRLNGKKTPLPPQPFGLVLAGVKDPEWEPPVPVEKKSKTSVGGSGAEQADSGPPPPVKVPFEVQRAMALRVQKSALPEGDRALPQAGLLFFQHRGGVNKIKSVELVYSGPTGNVTLALQP